MPTKTFPQDVKISSPKRVLKVIDAVALIVGIVIGAGIFRTPSLVAGNVDNEGVMLTAWLLGGLISLIGALCYAELATTFPNTGGDYHFLMRAFGRRLAFLFAWARMSVIQTGSIALLSFIFGDYASRIYPLGEQSTVIYAALAVIGLTGINLLGIIMGTATQKMLTGLELLGILVLIIIGLVFNSPAEAPSTVLPGFSGFSSSMGLSMVFVLLTFGGWNEAAYISAEMKSKKKAGQKQIALALVMSILIITGVYYFINLAYIQVLGLENMAGSTAVASDLMQVVVGDVGAWMISLLVAIAALTSANATIFTGARSNFALGRDFKIFAFMGKWDSEKSGPVKAFVTQGAISLVLVSFGLFSRDGFETMVDFTAPVFWFFLMMVGIALFVLRRKFPEIKRPFQVPLYPILPLIFCLSSSYLLYSSIVYTGWGALVGIAVLLVGILMMFIYPEQAKEQK
ncbi:MAG: amino acid permease [Cyclobacteriaceae bacterium]